jgi:acetoin utilization protein AcuC
MAGSMPHAMAARVSEFGVYNDVAIAIAWLLARGAGRIAYMDIDAHHGDGVQAAFWPATWPAGAGGSPAAGA